MKQAPRVTSQLCLKWTMLVSASAIASFVAALISGHATPTHIAAMICGIITFIAIYTVIDGWAEANALPQFRKSLRMGILVKIALELIPAIEIGAGIVASELVIVMRVKSIFPATYLKTILTGTLLSLVVGLIASLYWYGSTRLRARAQ